MVHKMALKYCSLLGSLAISHRTLLSAAWLNCCRLSPLDFAGRFGAARKHAVLAVVHVALHARCSKQVQPAGRARTQYLA